MLRFFCTVAQPDVALAQFKSLRYVVMNVAAGVVADALALYAEFPPRLVATRGWLSDVAGAGVGSVKLVAVAKAVPACVKLTPSVLRWMRKPVWFVELSCQVRLTVVALAAVALRLVGAAGGAA